MGKSNYKKARNKVSNPSESKPKGLSAQKKNEINDIVKKLLKLSSQITTNSKQDWEVHVEISKLLHKLQNIEPVLDTTKSREDLFPNLMTWIKENGGIAENVCISKFEGMDYGLKAMTDFKEEELICSIPKKLMMTLENVKSSSLKYLMTSDPIIQNMGNIALAIFLIFEYLKNENSFWYPYISSLPFTYNTILYFTVEDFMELKCSPVFEPALKHYRNIARQYAYFHKLFQSSTDEASLIFQNNFTYQLYRWAVSTVMTRQNFVPSENGTDVNCLIPLWDMCNHTNGYLTTQYIEERSECVACKPFRKGEQILIFYGERSNSDFLLHNGFVYENNKHDNFRLRLGISKADKLYELRAELLRELGISETGDFFISSSSEPIRDQLLAFLRIFNMDKDHLEHWKASNRLGDLMWKDCALDTQVERKVWSFLYNRINLLMGKYSQDVEVGNNELSECRSLIRSHLSLEKNFLKSFLEYVQQRIKL